MAQNYEIDIKRFNGRDYDTLLPTPASHASTHQANGSDPLTLQEGNYGNLSIPTSAYQNASVTRAKLAKDVLYSPIQPTSTSATYSFTESDLGKTVAPSSGAANLDIVYTMPHSVATALPFGAEIAVLFRYGKSLKINFEAGSQSAIVGDNFFVDNRTYEIPERFGMVALKKVDYSTSSNTQFWLVTGNAEVVT